MPKETERCPGCNGVIAAIPPRLTIDYVRAIHAETCPAVRKVKQ
jgi:hypothetical protein